MSAEPIIVRATDDDLAEFAVRRWRDGASQRLYQHLAQSAPGGAWVARDVDTLVGIGFTTASDAAREERYVSELYVEPAYRNQGIGRGLFAQLEDANARYCGLLDPQDSSALGFALARGMALRAPVVRLSGAIPPEEELAALAQSAYRFRVERIDLAAHGAALDGLDREVRGFARSEDHRLFAALAHGCAIWREAELVGYVYLWSDGRVGPLVSASAAYSAPCFAFALVTLQRELGARWCSAGVPGENLRVLQAGLRLGLKIDRMRLFASGVPASDLSRYVGFHPLVF